MDLDFCDYLKKKIAPKVFVQKMDCLNACKILQQWSFL